MRESHGHSKDGKISRVYQAWMSMRKRCRLNNRSDFDRYAARGITVCERWNSFEHFLTDMGEPPAGMSLDRVDNDKGYSKDNCRWATPHEQGLNKRTSAYVELNGQKLRVRDIEISLGLSQGAPWHRIKKGWSLDAACTTPKGQEAHS